jgi:hypothetical protein
MTLQMIFAFELQLAPAAVKHLFRAVMNPLVAGKILRVLKLLVTVGPITSVPLPRRLMDLHVFPCSV